MQEVELKMHATDYLWQMAVNLPGRHTAAQRVIVCSVRGRVGAERSNVWTASVVPHRCADAAEAPPALRGDTFAGPARAMAP